MSGYATTFGDELVVPLSEAMSAFLEDAGVPVDETAGAAHFAGLDQIGWTLADIGNSMLAE